VPEFFFVAILNKFEFSGQICLKVTGRGGFTVKLVKNFMFMVPCVADLY